MWSEKANTRISLIYQEADDLVAEFSLYCPIILVVVIAVIAMVLARMVKREGKTIGTLLALGYRKKELVRYMVYGMIPAFAGGYPGDPSLHSVFQSVLRLLFRRRGVH